MLQGNASACIVGVVKHATQDWGATHQQQGAQVGNTKCCALSQRAAQTCCITQQERRSKDCYGETGFDTLRTSVWYAPM